MTRNLGIGESDLGWTVAERIIECGRGYLGAIIPADKT